MIKRILIFLLAISMLAGCGREIPPSPTREPHRDTPAEPAMVYDDSLLTEFTYEKTIGEGDSEIQVSYKLPQILDDTFDADNLNELFRWYQQDAEESEYPTFESITWERYWNGSLLSILLKAQPLGQGEMNYLPVNYDFAQGREVPPWEVPEWVGISEEEALAALRRTAAQEFDNFMADTLEACTECYDDVVKLRAATLSESALNLATTMLYLDDLGELNASLTLYTMSGGGYHYLTAPLRVAPENDKVLRDGYANVLVENSGSGLQVTFKERDEESPDDIFLKTVDAGIPYPVEGFYGEVRDMAVGGLGYANEIFLVVVDQAGQLYYSNLSHAAMIGGGIRLAGPIQNPRDIVSLTAEPSEPEIYAVTEDGNNLPVFEAICQTEMEVTGILDGTLWMTEDGSMEVTMEVVNDMPAIHWSSDGTTADGFYYFDGITEKGLHIRGNLMDEDFNNRNAVMTFSVPDWWDFSTSVMTLTFIETGETMELTLPQE